ncbi:Desumoylating isopeptidase 2 [Seminavis robusta]|uniref:Desumoylating isopeptidase 2 n=1 Tax=Seminavis robusta TaxID=568900 RepID=A0A9N8E4X9_9STRA|nr:Desumoylating isopeptidase 2 [Seminavis robusta]|eukprot:Sro672_g185140.1 Desumoylating isopeptidase 2 (246) ;mRNA; f:49944-50758
MSEINASKTEDSFDNFPVVCPTETEDSNDSVSVSTADTSGSKVYLNVYDLNPVNFFLGPVGIGLYHSGVEIDGFEYSFASRGGGIFKIEPRKARGVRFYQQIEMGSIDEEQGIQQLQRALDELKDGFQPQKYDFVTNNCNHFCNALLVKLLGKGLPGHVNRMSYLWTTANIPWLVPKNIRRNAPVGDKNLEAYKGIIPFLRSITDVSNVVISEWIDASSSLSDVVSTTKGLSLLLDDQCIEVELD